MPSAEHFIRTHILCGPKAYRNVLLYERCEQAPVGEGKYPRIVYKCRLCETGGMPKKQVQAHCQGKQHREQYAPLEEAMIALPSNNNTNYDQGGKRHG